MRFRAQDRRFGVWFRRKGPETTLALLTVSLAAAAVLFVRLLPPSAVFPALSLLIIAAALSIAGAAWVFSARRNTDTVSYWDLAGGLMLIGVSAALLANSDRMLLD